MKNHQSQSSLLPHPLHDGKLGNSRSPLLRFVALFAVLVWCVAPQPTWGQQTPLQLSQQPSKQTSLPTPLPFEKCPVFAIDSVEIPAKETGVLAELIIKPNQEVSQDAILAKFDSLQAESERNVAMLQSQIAKNEANDDSDVKFAQALLEESRLSLESYEQIRARGSASDADVRQKQLSVTQAELKLLGAKQQLEQRKLRSKIALATLQSAEERLKRQTLMAPFAGVVTETMRKPGEWVQAGQPVCRVVRLDELRVDFYVSLEEVEPDRLLNATVDVTASRANMKEMRFTGRVTGYDSEVSSRGLVRVHATIQNQKTDGYWKLLPGMTAQLHLLPNSEAPSIRSAQRTK